MRSRARVEAGGLEVELQAMQAVERKIAEVGAARRDEVLLVRRQAQHVVLERGHMPDLPVEPLRCAAQDRRAQCAAVVGGDEEAQRPRSIQLAVAHARAASTLGAEAGTQMREVVEVSYQRPWAEALVLAHQCSALAQATPHDDPPVGLRMHRHDPGSGIPAPEPFLRGRVRARHAESYYSSRG